MGAGFASCNSGLEAWGAFTAWGGGAVSAGLMAGSSGFGSISGFCGDGWGRLGLLARGAACGLLGCGACGSLAGGVCGGVAGGLAS